MDVLLVAAKKEEMGDLTNLALEAKLRPRIVDLDAFTVQNCYETAYGPPPADQTVVLLHVGASLTTLNILSQGTTAFTRDVVNGGNAITEEIQRRFGVSQEEAEAFKCGAAPEAAPADLPDIIRGVVETLAGEIQRSLDFYLATTGDREVHRVYLSGGTANVVALQQELAQRCQVEVSVLDPLLIAQPDPKTVDPMALEGRTAQAVVAYGLALRKERERRPS
jgi:type IV pilus assembly protein PilM